jgi:EmrB/QacA subfamily drug resistance transporter
VTPPAGHVPVASRTGRLTVATTAAGTTGALLTASVVNVALPTIATDLGASSSEQQWVVNAYLLTLASLILVGGALGDRFGRVRLYRIGVVWLGGASVLCALAPTTGALIAARLVQGMGAALLMPGSLAIIESTLRPDDRARGVGRWTALNGIASAAGPLLGGLLVDVSWRLVFLLNLPIALAVLLASGGIPETSDDEARDGDLDVTGAALAVIALGGLAWAFTQGPAGGWSTWDVVAGVAAVSAIAAAVVLEPRRRRPVVPVDLFAIRPFVAANAITLFVYGGLGVVFFLLAIHLQVTVGWSPLETGAALMPITALMMVLSSWTGDLAQRIGPRWPLTGGPVLIAGGMLLLTRIGPGASYLTDVLPAVAVFGLGLAWSVAPVTATALGTIPDHRSGAASGLNNAMARTGQLLAVAAIPPLVGLTGDALREPDELDAGFPAAMLVGAGLVLVGAIVALVTLRSDDLAPDHRTSDDGSEQERSGSAGDG